MRDKPIWSAHKIVQTAVIRKRHSALAYMDFRVI